MRAATIGVVGIVLAMGMGGAPRANGQSPEDATPSTSPGPELTCEAVLLGQPITFAAGSELAFAPFAHGTSQTTSP